MPVNAYLPPLRPVRLFFSMEVIATYRVLRAVMYLVKYWDKPLNGYPTGRENLIAMTKGTWPAGDFHMESNYLHPGSDPIVAIDGITADSLNYKPFLTACMKMTEGICNDVLYAEYEEE